jgi:enterochelin esterase family protein
MGNNRAVAEILRAAGHRVTLRSLPDLHNYTAWRDGLHPSLTDLLRSTWVAPG